MGKHFLTLKTEILLFRFQIIWQWILTVTL